MRQYVLDAHALGHVLGQELRAPELAEHARDVVQDVKHRLATTSRVASGFEYTAHVGGLDPRDRHRAEGGEDVAPEPGASFGRGGQALDLLLRVDDTVRGLLEGLGLWRGFGFQLAAQEPAELCTSHGCVIGAERYALADGLAVHNGCDARVPRSGAEFQRAFSRPASRVPSQVHPHRPSPRPS
ncbi:MAG: hypothetical protein JW940_29865 [Polyangiaceae bacterium]|nr:hypothetical protein [Polyangiaceae bacterium]